MQNLVLRDECRMCEPDLESTKIHPWILQYRNMVSAGMVENAAVDDNEARKPSANPRIQSLTAQINPCNSTPDLFSPSLF